MRWYDKLLIKAAHWRNVFFSWIGSVEYEGWCYIFLMAIISQLLSLFLPMITVVIFTSLFMWFVNYVKFFYYQEDNPTWKPVICGAIGAIVGIGLSYLMAIPHEIIWF